MVLDGSLYCVACQGNSEDKNYTYAAFSQLIITYAAFSQLIIHGMPNRSTSIPKRWAQKVS